MNSIPLRFNIYLPAAILYFFLNGFLLPVGLLYTTLLAPVLLFWIARYRNINYFLVYFLLVIPFVIAHSTDGIEDGRFYLYSIALSFTVLVFCIAFHQYLLFCHSLRDIYKKILLINAGLVLVALGFLFLPSMRTVFWNANTLSLGPVDLLRLKMLTYEPSYYSLLFAPIAIYYLLKVLRRELPRPVVYCVLVLVPLFLSLSFGVILGIALALFLLLIVHAKTLIFDTKNKGYFITGGVLAVAVVGFFLFFFPDNVFFRRLQNIAAGQDTSFNGRTWDSFILSVEIARKKSILWGAGFGQVKVLGLDVFRNFYRTHNFTVHDVAIPNSIGDLLATLGLFGVGIKLFLETYFFFKTRVFSNYYRLALFLFIFVYQFSGSFIMNIVEYVIWILAFTPGLFPEFDKKPAL
ncbi:hypothetical protein [Puia dinghuensis]|uniref:O-antigen ligase domain-containing protein n=1 Tax=Puia dinghuensis TaxID=1792502 RepID=A0A8J2UEF3_9BACT|nr:hypothetical protein [Puia dinghuensis]GGB06311.1 hypothetical protein GCM10011511_32140 [Puia dinghuensis]